MASQNPARTNALLLAGLLFFQLLLMSGSVRRHDGSTMLETALMWVSSPFVRAAGATGGAVRWSVTQVSEIFQARTENELLREQVRELRVENIRMLEGTLESSRLRRLLGMRQYLAPESVGASVVSARLEGQERMMIVDRGSKDGVEVDFAVVAYGGVVGKVVLTGSGFAKVRLMTDPNSGIAAVVQRSRSEGMVFGQGDGTLQMEYVSRFMNVKLGDRVVTSGRDDIFPVGFTVGNVSYVGDAEVSKVIRLHPTVDFRSLEEVLILLERSPAEQLTIRDGVSGR